MKVYIINVDEATENTLTEELNNTGYEFLVFEKVSNLLGVSAISGDSPLIIGDEYHIEDIESQYNKMTALSKNPIVFFDKKQILDGNDNLLLLKPNSDYMETLFAFLENKKKLKVKKTPISRKEMSIDADNHFFSVMGKTVNLTKTEFSIIHYMMASERMSISHEDLMIVFKNKQKKINLNTLANHIRNINTKIFKATDEKRFITSVYGFGYGIVGND